MDNDVKAKLRSIGAEAPGEMPPDVREAMDDLKARKRGTCKVGVEIKRLTEEQVFVYEDEYLKLTIPNVRLDIYFEFIEELGRLDRSERNYDVINCIARAFWLLHNRPKRWRKWKFPRVSEKRARDFLVKKIPNATIVFNSLNTAFGEYSNWVIQPKKKVNEATSAAPPKPSPE